MSNFNSRNPYLFHFTSHLHRDGQFSARIFNEGPIFVGTSLLKILTRSCSKRCRSTRSPLCRRCGSWSRRDTAGISDACSACTPCRRCKIYRTARRIARTCVLGAIVRRTPWTGPFFSGTVDQPSASCEHKAARELVKCSFELGTFTGERRICEGWDEEKIPLNR